MKSNVFVISLICTIALMCLIALSSGYLLGNDRIHKEQVLNETTEPTVGEKDDNFIYIWTDKETGVEYIVYRERERGVGFCGITPRLDADGNIMVSSSTEPTA